MHLEILYKIEGIIHKAAKMYLRHQDKSAADHAKDLQGKVRDRETGEILYDYCPESKKKKG